MDNPRLVNLSNLMIERNIILNILDTLSRDLKLKEIDQNLYEIIRAKYTAKLETVDIQIANNGRNLACSKCEQRLEREEHLLSCINCGFPFHEYHLKESPISFENICFNCGSIYQVKQIDNFVTIELKKVENHTGKLQTQISLIDVNVDGIPIKLPYSIEKLKPKEIIKKTSKVDNCPKCGSIVNFNWRYCKKCGYFLKEKTSSTNMNCINCGTILDKNWKFCKWCGKPTGF